MTDQTPTHRPPVVMRIRRLKPPTQRRRSRSLRQIFHPRTIAVLTAIPVFSLAILLGLRLVDAQNDGFFGPVGGQDLFTIDSTQHFTNQVLQTKTTPSVPEVRRWGQAETHPAIAREENVSQTWRR